MIFLFIDSLDGDLSLLTLNFLRIIAIGTTLFQYRTAYKKYHFGLGQHVHIVYFKIWLIVSNRGIIYHIINGYM